MKTTELIKTLEQLVKEHGDLEVFTWDDEMAVEVDPQPQLKVITHYQPATLLSWAGQEKQTIIVL